MSQLRRPVRKKSVREAAKNVVDEVAPGFKNKTALLATPKYSKRVTEYVHKHKHNSRI